MSCPTFPTPSYLICPVCSQPVEIESAKTDEEGRPVHEGCYIFELTSQLPLSF